MIKREEDAWHCGLHPRNCERIVEHARGETLRKFLFELRDRCERLTRGQDERNPLYIVLFCKSGRDRSVGVSRVLHQVLERNQSNWLLAGTLHLCESRWRTSGARCKQNGCKICLGKAKGSAASELPWARI